ncbi:podocalyxin-like protein 2 [Rhinatrema bivittatum]|uniref:podocalyxin-like protein 2 n=1 Tax=Rhinatrema bivittatum TaxID=194408 RepID=UPI00112907BF|nr:podocalyxin-like protein 2 [Rhinatrema bivittatum]
MGACQGKCVCFRRSRKVHPVGLDLPLPLVMEEVREGGEAELLAAGEGSSESSEGSSILSLETIEEAAVLMPAGASEIGEGDLTSPEMDLAARRQEILWLQDRWADRTPAALRAWQEPVPSPVPSRKHKCSEYPMILEDIEEEEVEKEEKEEEEKEKLEADL